MQHRVREDLQANSGAGGEELISEAVKEIQYIHE